MLTNTKIKALKPKEVKYRKADYDGLSLVVFPVGKNAPSCEKACYVRHRVNGKQREMAIGQFPAMLVADAREKLKAVKSTIESGADPVKVKRDVKYTESFRLDNTFKVIAVKWMYTKREWPKDYRHNIEKRLLSHAYPAIGDTPVTGESHDDLEKIINRLVTRGLKSDTISKTYQNIITILDYTIAARLIKVNFARDIKPLHQQGMKLYIIQHLS